ncbi:transposase [Sphingopyxis sp.]|uniref:transposase n=1 Tax=Sphingopyxis sp. TaxID=1908224 RepID=UPI00344B3876
MPGKDGFIQAYNGQIAVDATAQIIVAHSLSNSSADSTCLIPLTDAVTRNMEGKKAREISADAGYCSEANLAGLKDREISAYIATGQPSARRPEARWADRSPRRCARSSSLADTAVAIVYANNCPNRFSDRLQARGSRQFLLRGLDKVQDEWSLVCIAHNITKLWAVA